MRGTIAAVLLTLVCPGAAAAQLPILEGLFKKVSDVNLYGTLAWFTDRPDELAGSVDGTEAKAGTLSGLGFEVSFVVGEFSPRVKEEKDPTIKEEPRTRDTVEVQRPEGGATVVYKPVPLPGPDPDYRWQVELALGYTELRDFEPAPGAPDLRGAVRELPAVSLYFSRQPEGPDTAANKERLGWYLGLRTGLAHLHGLRGYVGDPDSGPADAIYNGGGNTFQVGALAGLVYRIRSVTTFLELAYTHRPFSGVEWQGVSGALADALPRSLDMSTLGLSLGTQIEIGATADD